VGLAIDTARPVDRAGNAFCGPLVVAAILGTSTGNVATEVANLRCKLKGARMADGTIKRIRGRRADKVRGTYNSELFAVLESRGLLIESVPVGGRWVEIRKCRGRSTYVNGSFTRMARGGMPPWGDWYPVTLITREGRSLWMLRQLFASGTYIVQLPGHWALAHDGLWCETHTSGQWVDIRVAPKSSRKVLQAWKITQGV
jgi:hypothetical protein